MPGLMPDALREALEQQNGVVSRAQLLDAGVSPRAISTRVGNGQWQRLHAGVYAAFSGEPTQSARWWAAVLRAGSGAMLSHRTAAEADGLIRAGSGLIHVTVPGERHVLPIPGMVVHRSERADRTRHPARLPPRTRVEETVLDLAAAASDYDEVFDWLCQACAGRFTTPGKLRAAMAARGKLRWRAEMSGALDEVSEGAHSGLERRYHVAVEHAHGLPAGVRQARSARGRRTEYRDVLYEDYGVVVETDGRAAHPEGARRADAARDNAAAARGLTTLRYGWSDVRYRPCAVAAEVAAVLRHHGWLGLPARCGSGCPVRAMLLPPR